MTTCIGQISDGYHTFDELYAHRCALFIALLDYIKVSGVGPPVWKSKFHADGSMFEGWFVAGIGTLAGNQITYHLPIHLWDKVHVRPRGKAPKWDGHTSADVVKRLYQI